MEKITLSHPYISASEVELTNGAVNYLPKVLILFGQMACPGHALIYLIFIGSFFICATGAEISSNRANLGKFKIAVIRRTNYERFYLGIFAYYLCNTSYTFLSTERQDRVYHENRFKILKR